MKQIKVEWCENFIKAVFKRKVPGVAEFIPGVSGIWRKGQDFGSVEPMGHQ